jgi:peptidyl-prolyl cis-trans isomerase C
VRAVRLPAAGLAAPGGLCHLTAVGSRLMCTLGVGALLWLCGAGCDRRPAAGPGSQTVVARIDGEAITLQEFERRLHEQSAFTRARYASPDRRKALLEQLVRFELLAREAKKRGYDRDPAVVLAAKQRVVERMIAEELDGKLRPQDLPEAEVARYYREHMDHPPFTQAEAVRVSQVLVKDRAEAAKVVALARKLGGNGKDDGKDAEEGFRRVVATLSLDEDSKQRGGDLGFLERGNGGGQGGGGDQPRAVIEAAFALRALGEVSEPVESPRGFHVLRLTQRRVGFVRPYEEVRDQARAQLHYERRAQRLEQWVAEMRRKVPVEVYEDKLSQVAAEAPPQRTPGQ